jgi:hypothetical protein
MMKRKIGPILLLVTALSMITFIGVQAEGQADLAQLRAATAQFHRVEAAQEAGYVLIPGLDHCFDNPGVGGMGIHYINPDLLDLHLDPNQPEAMVYVIGPNGNLDVRSCGIHRSCRALGR